MPENVNIYSPNYLFDPYCTFTGSAERSDSYAAEYVADRNPDTSWQAATSGAQNLVIYLGPIARTIDRLLFSWNLAAYEIQYSTDGSSYTSWTTATGQTATSGSITLTSQSVKYIKVICTTGISSPSYFVIYNLAACAALGSFSADEIEKLDIMELEDGSQSTQETWDGMPVVSGQLNFAPVRISVALNLVSAANYETYRGWRRSYRRVLVLPEPSTHADRWYQCCWEKTGLNFLKPRTAGYGGTVDWRGCA